jgi:hypothetical protein
MAPNFSEQISVFSVYRLNYNLKLRLFRTKVVYLLCNILLDQSQYSQVEFQLEWHLQEAPLRDTSR